ncbi:tubulin-tyrosine ligase family protein, putative [Ichthyophthirius multifiliis]|uniref:Tubulin-tyrosine ligase family protein, putative n=1 Tax=Ichthyophthirius multifiliis TaxID=5932 RepID=G0R0D7_ICHMU|nr:tubulin-tyrosine ligase family protein, putative [Ichthyophthirius multifiliis]EGR29074.1 tubulin-tyrosine ligase family protein, putative [Ichthyophthirius multifiliis]|eukprot:XP_004030310.1 tubulin-tyrosine ligase family protein, putative [Ichthyophthirius multifiliis]
MFQAKDLGGFKQKKQQVNIILEKVTVDQIVKKNKKFTFELIGYDFMVTKQGQVLLIEANTNPCLELSNEILKKLIPRMLKTFNCYPNEFNVFNYLSYENLWELLGQI